MTYEELFWTAWRVAFLALPHHRQAAVLCFPGGIEWRELAARAALAAEDSA